MYHILSAGGLIGKIQAHHDYGHSRGKYYPCGLRVCIDVELCGRRGIACAVGASHEHDLTDLWNDGRLHAHGHGYIAEGTHRNQGDIAVTFHESVDYELYCMLRLSLEVQGAEDRTVKACIAVDICSDYLLPHYGPLHAGIYRCIYAKLLAEIESVDEILLQDLIAGDHGDTEKVDGRMLCSHHYGYRIIMSGITVQDYLSFFHSFLHFI